MRNLIKKQNKMQQDKSFLTTFRPFNTKINDVYLKSRSLSSKGFTQKRSYNLPQTKQYQYQRTYDQCNFNRNLQPKSFSYKPSLRNLMDHNTRSRSQYYQTLFQQKEFPPLELMKFSKQKSNLFRSKSVNQVYQHHRIEMLHKINNYLQDHLNRKHQESQIKEIKRKQQFQSQVIARLDKLEKYLYKIKSQRQKEHKPKLKQIIQNNFINKNQNQQKIISQNIPLPINKPPKNQYLQALSQLEKIKQQLIKVRLQAISVKQRNSLSKNKQQNPQQKERYKNFQNKLSTQILSYNKQFNHSFLPLQNPIQDELKNEYQKNKSYDQGQQFQKPIKIRMNNHINQNNFSYNTNTNKPFEKSVKNCQKSSPKPKITFSFVSKV